jgi:hypothetical protein
VLLSWSPKNSVCENWLEGKAKMLRWHLVLGTSMTGSMVMAPHLLSCTSLPRCTTLDKTGSRRLLLRACPKIFSTSVRVSTNPLSMFCGPMHMVEKPIVCPMQLVPGRAVASSASSRLPPSSRAFCIHSRTAHPRLPQSFRIEQHLDILSRPDSPEHCDSDVSITVAPIQSAHLLRDMHSPHPNGPLAEYCIRRCSGGKHSIAHDSSV